MLERSRTPNSRYKCTGSNRPNPRHLLELATLLTPLVLVGNLLLQLGDLPIVQHALEEVGVLPSREPEQVAKPEREPQETAELLIEGTERRRQRPKNKTKQTLHYSGKHKTHSDKNLVGVNAKTKRVGYLSQTDAGKMHDKKNVDSEPICSPPATILDKDTGFQGYEPQVQQTHQPKKSRAKGR